MQRIFNYGSSLQAYALRRLLEEAAPGSRVGFVDYRAAAPLLRDDGGAVGPVGATSRVITKLREYSKVDAPLRDKLRFFNHKRSYAAKYFPLIGITAARDERLDLGLQVIGSDEVFNCVQANTNVGYARDLFGHGSPAKRIVSYAGSFGNTTLKKIEEAGIREDLAEDFRRFDQVSVRDRNSQSIVAALTGKSPTIHLDPTLVYDFNSDSGRIPLSRQHRDPYIIVYGYSGRLGATENAAIRTYASQIGARILAFGGLQGSADEFIDCDPFALLAYFRDAVAVVTDTFHGTIFSIINEVPFATIIRTSAGHGYGNEEKLGFLLEKLGLADRALRDPGDLARLLSAPIDYSAVRAVRQDEAARTTAYLSDATRGLGA